MKIALLNKYLMVIRYILISLFTAVIEAVIGYLLMNENGLHIIGANTLSIFIGSSLHYLLISKKVFNKKYSVYTVLVYFGTFVLGIILQNYVIYYAYEQLLNNFSTYYRYIGSKFLSIVIPFILVYTVRKKLYLTRS